MAIIISNICIMGLAVLVLAFISISIVTFLPNRKRAKGILFTILFLLLVGSIIPRLAISLL